MYDTIPGFISSAGVTGRWGLPSYALKAVRWLAFHIRKVAAAMLINAKRDSQTFLGLILSFAFLKCG